jgi:hypothetical protein
MGGMHSSIRIAINEADAPAALGMIALMASKTPHAGGKNGDKKTKLAITYVVEKGKPLVSPA